MPRRLLSVYGHEFKMLTVLDPGWCAASSAYIGVAFSLVGRRVSAHADQQSAGWRFVVAARARPRLLTVELKTAWSIITCVRLCCHRPAMSSTRHVLFAVGTAAQCVVYRNCRSFPCVWCSGCRASARHVVKAVLYNPLASLLPATRLCARDLLICIACARRVAVFPLLRLFDPVVARALPRNTLQHLYSNRVTICYAFTLSSKEAATV